MIFTSFEFRIGSINFELIFTSEIFLDEDLKFKKLLRYFRFLIFFSHIYTYIVEVSINFFIHLQNNMNENQVKLTLRKCINLKLKGNRNHKRKIQRMKY